MAEGDGGIYRCFKEDVMEGVHNLASGQDSIKVMLVSGYTPLPDSHALKTVVDGTSTELTGAGYSAGGKALTAQDVTETGTGGTAKGKFDAGDLTWTSIDAGTPTYGVMFNDGATALVDPLMAYWEVTTPTNGGDYTLQWHANGIITIT